MKQEIALASGNAHAKMQVTSLPFSAVPGQSQLFLTYLDDPASVADLYPNLAQLRADPQAFAARVLENYETDRMVLCDALADINSAAGAGPATTANIDKLRMSDTVAVVTGQQAGLFTGPAYTIHKAISAIKFAAELTSQGTNAVPVFWAATEDHDMDEVATAYFLDQTDQVADISYRPASHVPDSPVATGVIDDPIRGVIEAVFGLLPRTEFSGEMREIVEDSYRPGAGYGQAFAAMMSRMFSEYGLVVVDPMNEALKRLASPIYRRAVERSDEIVATIVERTSAIEARGFHAQVLVEEDHFPLFWHDDQGRRKALRKVDADTFRAKHDRREFTRGELADIASNDPLRLSPNVMLRAVVQDRLFPTICYFGGAAEVAYFAQNSAAYETLGQLVTPIMHRQSFTVVEPRQKRALEKLNIQFRDLFAGKQAITFKVAEQLHAGDAARTFADVEETVNTQLNRLDELLSEENPTLAANLATRRRKIIYHIAELRRKALLAAVRRDETASRRIDSLFSHLMPNGALQERSINVVVYLNKFGPGFIDWLYEAADLDDRGHRIIEL